MILTRDFYAVKCDRCGAISKSLDDKVYFPEEFIATYEAEKHGYKRKYAMDFCPNCHVVDRVTEKVLTREQFPNELRALNYFIDHTLGAERSHFVGLDDNFYSIDFRLGNRELKDFEKEFIKGLLAEKFISLDEIQDDFNRTSYEIKMKRDAKLYG